MRKLYLVIVEPDTIPVTMLERIQSIGDSYRLYDSYVIFSEIQTSEKLYNSIVRQDFTSAEIVVFELPINTDCYFGYSDRDLWEWLSENITSVKSAINDKNSSETTSNNEDN